MKIIIKYIFLFFFVGATLMTTSCSKWLNVSPKTEMKSEDLFLEESGFRDALIGVYAIMSTFELYGGRLTFEYLDVMAQYYNTRSSSHNHYEISLYRYTDAAEEAKINEIWGRAYKAIANVNSALENIDKNRDVFTSDDIYHIYKGEFLGLRAMLHFDVLRLFASSPEMENYNSTLAIPYIDKFTNISQEQKTVKQVLDLIVADITLAKELMKGRETFGTEDYDDDANEDNMKRRVDRMNYSAVTALLARVQLYAGNKTEALAAAKEIIGEASNTVSPTSFLLATKAATSTDPMFKSEHIFRIDVQQLEDRVRYFNSENSSAVVFKLTSAAKANIITTGDDFRNSWISQSSSMITKYSNDDIKYIPMLKLSELYLIAAECAGGQVGLDYLNKFNFHRGLDNITDVNNLTSSIYKQYRTEFIGEGQLFFFYKRNNYAVIGAEDKIGIDNSKLVYNFPIPTNEVDYGNIKF